MRTLWHEPGIFCNEPDSFDPQWAADAGFTWAALLMADGRTVYPEKDSSFQVARVRKAGLQPVLWTVLETEPEYEARLASGLIQKHNMVGYIPNMERPYKAYWSDTDALEDQEERFGRARRFALAFRQLQPYFPVMASVLLPHLNLDVDYDALFEYGFHVGPQAYEIELGAAATPHDAVWGTTQFVGYDSTMVHPTIEVAYKGMFLPAHKVVQDIMNAATAAGPPRYWYGYSLYVGERVRLEDWSVYENFNATTPLALKRSEPMPKLSPLNHKMIASQHLGKALDEWKQRGVNTSNTKVRRSKQVLDSTDKQYGEVQPCLERTFG